MSKTLTRKPVTKTVPTRLAAKLLPDAPAKVTRRTMTGEDVRAKMTRFDATRTPDVLDYEDGEVAWFGDGIVVVVKIEHLPAFRSWVSCHGMVRTESYRVEVLDPRKEWGWKDVWEAAAPRKAA